MPGAIVPPQQLAFYRGHIHDVVRPDGVVCLECGALCWRLGKHVAVHGLNAAAYRAKWGYRRKAQLVLPVPPELRRHPPTPRAPRRTVSARELEHYRRHIREAVQEDGVVCLECGGVYQFLGGVHVRSHEITGAEYREKWGYNQGSGLVSPALHKRKRQIALDRNLWALSPPGSYRKAKEAQMRRRSPHRTEARLNKSDQNRALYAAGWRPGDRRIKASDETLRALAAEGLTLRAMAERVGMTYGSLLQRVSGLGLAGPRIRPAPLPVAPEKLLALRRAGLTARQIAARTGLTLPAVNGRLAMLRRRGVVLPPAIRGRRIPGPDPRQVLTLLGRGLRTGQIAARLQTPRYRIYETVRRLRERGLVAPHGIPQQARHDPRILELNRAALWPSEIAARLGLSARYVNSRLSVLRRRGVAVHRPRGPRPHWRPRVSNEELLALARARLRPTQIATRVGMKLNAVGARLRWLRRRGRLSTAPWDPHAKRKPYTDEQVLALARGGLGSGQIAGQLGISQITVGRRLRALREQGLLPPRRAGELNARDRQILELRRAGLWPQEIAARLGIPANVIRPRLSKLRARGIAVPTPARPRPNARRRAAIALPEPPGTATA